MGGNILNNLGSLPVVFETGKGATLTAVDGKKYTDFVAGIGVNCLGHNHSELVKALSDQVSRAIHVSNYYNSDKGLEFSAGLLKRTGYEKVFFANSGAEANENAIKIARKVGYERAVSEGRSVDDCKTIITLKKSFHGRTLETLRATGQDKFHSPSFSPYTEKFLHIQAGDYEVLKTCFTNQVCGFMFERIQGEGGVNVIDLDWLNAAMAAAKEAGAINIVDEVQTGIGRTGTFLASEDLKIQPDVVTLAKGIAGGVPMGAVLARGKAASIIVAGDLQSTFGGNPLACSGGIVVLKNVGDKAFLADVIKKGEYIRSQILSWNLPCVKEIRGKGLMIGIELFDTNKNLASSLVQKECLNRGLCISTAGEYVLRFLPPLVISLSEIETGLKVLHSVLSDGMKDKK